MAFSFGMSCLVGLCGGGVFSLSRSGFWYHVFFLYIRIMPRVLCMLYNPVAGRWQSEQSDTTTGTRDDPVVHSRKRVMF